MEWFDANREQLEEEHPGQSAEELLKIARKLFRRVREADRHTRLCRRCHTVSVCPYDNGPSSFTSRICVKHSPRFLLDFFRH